MSNSMSNSGSNAGNRSESICAELASLPTDQWEAYLSRECGNDAQLRLQIQALLSVQANEQQKSIQLPGYELCEEIGRGGMGIVYRARDLRFDRDVAIKLLGDRIGASSYAATRFRTEARITGQLQHPGIPAAHDLGTLEDGKPFLAMKLVKGQTLQQLLDLRANPAQELGRFISIFEQLCHAIGYAHSHNVIHRDLKPANVMVGKHGEVQVMDWGLAKVLFDPPAKEEIEINENTSTVALLKSSVDTPDAGGSATKTGSILGTPAFMPPEQALGEIRSIDARSDVFGLGGILCQILTNRPPYEGEDFHEVRVKAVRGELQEAISELDACGAEVDLIALCKKCLAYRMEDRPLHGQAVADEISRHRARAEARAREAEMARSAALIREAEEKKRRKQLLYASGTIAAVLLLGVIGTTIGLFQARQAAQKERRAAREAQSMNQHAVEAYGKMVFEIQNKLQGQTELHELRTSLLQTAQNGLNKLREESPRAAAPNRATAWIHMQLGDLALNLGNTALAQKEYQSAHKLTQTLAQSDPQSAQAHRDISASLGRLSNLMLEQQQPQKALEFCEQVNAILERVLATDPDNAEVQRDVSINYCRTGDALVLLGKQAAAHEMYKKAEKIDQRLAAAQTTDPLAQHNLSISYERLGDSARDLGLLAEATEFYRKKVNITQALIAKDPKNQLWRHDLTIGYDRLGELAMNANRLPEALDYYQQSLAINLELANSTPIAKWRRSLGIAYEQLGNLQRRMRQPAAAYDLHRQALAIREALVQLDRENAKAKIELIINYNNLGELEKSQRAYDKAAEWFLKAKLIIEPLALEGKLTEQVQSWPTWIVHNYEVCSKAETALADMEFVFKQSSAEQVQELALFRIKDQMHRRQTADAIATADRFSQWIETLEEPKRREPHNTAACGFSLCAAGEGGYEKPQEKPWDEPQAERVEMPIEKPGEKLVEKLNEKLVEKAVDHLEKAKAGGYFNANTISHLRQDADLDAIREHPKFVAFVQSLQEK